VCNGAVLVKDVVPLTVLSGLVVWGLVRMRKLRVLPPSVDHSACAAGWGPCQVLTGSLGCAVVGGGVCPLNFNRHGSPFSTQTEYPR
jgi:hypothetical protein